MSTVRVVPLGAPAVAGLWVGGEVGAVTLAVLSVVVLLLVGRAVHFRLNPQDPDVQDPDVQDADAQDTDAQERAVEWASRPR